MICQDVRDVLLDFRGKKQTFLQETTRQVIQL